MKKLTALVCCLSILLGLGTFRVFGIGLPGTYGKKCFQINKRSSSGSLQITSYSTLTDAFNDVADGERIGLLDEVNANPYSTAESITVDKKVTLTGFIPLLNKYPTFISTYYYTGTAAPFLTIASGGDLTLASVSISGNTNAVQKAGGLVHINKGGTLRLKVDEYDATQSNGSVKHVIQNDEFKNSKLTATDSKGGAIYVEKGGRLIVENVVFSGNSAKSGSNYYAESGALVIWDLTGDRTIDVRDFVRQKRHLADSSVTVNGTADSNSDRAKNSADLVVIKSYLLKG
ncbi:MAG: hypothetical protein MJ132_01025 [Clostridia bacterium]|nr:hypothetical protein [Clostridia bacterium]